jgi:hypothetical protein
MSEPGDDLLAGWQGPAAPPGLRERALAAARDPEVAPMPRRIEDRVWESRPLRLAWFAVAAVLVALNLTIDDRSAPQPARTVKVAEEQAIEDEVGAEIPPAPADGMTLAEAYRLAVALLDDPCLDPWSGGDCT